jgi:sporulation protein YlmC with PRC-barrel domain
MRTRPRPCVAPLVLAIMLAAVLALPPAAGRALAQPTPFADGIHATDLLDRDIHGSDGVRIGTVADLVEDPVSGLAAVVDLAPRDDAVRVPVVVPLRRLRPGAGRGLHLDMTRGQIDDVVRTRHRARDLLGRQVHGADGVAIGTIADLIVDPGAGRVVAAVVEVDEVDPRSGFAAEHVVVPVRTLRAGPDERLVLDMRREQFRDALAVRYDAR